MNSENPGPAVKYVHITVMAVSAFAVMSWQFAHPGYYHKIIEHAVMAERYVSAFAGCFGRGGILPGWMPDDFGGYGSPIFVYYSPVFYLLAAVPAYLGVSVPVSESLVDLLFLMAGGYGVYMLLREPCGGRAASAGALFFMLLPTRVMDLYYTNTPSGRIALGVLPYVLYFARGAALGGGRRTAVAGLAVSYGGLILTHLASAYIFTPFILAYGLVTGRGGGLRSRLPVTGAALLAGACLAGYVFLPVLFMRGEVHIGLMSSLEDYSAARNFMFSLGETSRVPGINALLGLYGNVVAAQAAAVAALYLASGRIRGGVLGRETGFYVAAALVSLFMMSSPSLFLWEHVPGLSTWSFPYRMVSLFTLFTALVAGQALARAVEDGGRDRLRRLLALAVVAALLAGSLVLVVRSSPLTPQNLAAGEGVVDFAEYLPASTAPGFLYEVYKDNAPRVSGEGFSFEVKIWYGQYRSFKAVSDKGGTVRLRTFSFPGWRAWVDGKEAAIRAEEHSGAILLDVPPGMHMVELRFTRNPYQLAGAALGILALAGLALMLVWNKRGRVSTE